MNSMPTFKKYVSRLYHNKLFFCNHLHSTELPYYMK